MLHDLVSPSPKTANVKSQRRNLPTASWRVFGALALRGISRERNMPLPNVFGTKPNQYRGYLMRCLGFEAGAPCPF